MSNPFLPSPRPVLGDVIELLCIAAFVAGIGCICLAMMGPVYA